MITIQTTEGVKIIPQEKILAQTQNLAFLKGLDLDALKGGEVVDSINNLNLTHIKTGLNIGILDNPDGDIPINFLTQLEDFTDWDFTEIGEEVRKQFYDFLVARGYLWNYITLCGLPRMYRYIWKEE